MTMGKLLKLLGALVAFVLWLLLLLVIASFLFNTVTSAGHQPVRQLWSGKFVEADGVLTAYQQWGTHGTPIVLIGGFVEPSFVWNEVGPELALNHRVYALDLDGFGYSERRGPWTLKEWGDQVEDFMRKLHLSKPIVVGHSLGAAVAVEIAHRDLASRIVLLDGDALTIGGPPTLVRSILVHTPFVTSAMRLATRWDWPVRKLIANAYGTAHPPITGAVVDEWTRPLKAKNAEHALATMAKRPLPGFKRSELQPLNVPATVVWGDHDDVDPRSAGEEAAKALHAPFVLIKGAGHLSMLLNPTAVAAAIEAS